jgi:hypothetical protein
LRFVATGLLNNSFCSAFMGAGESETSFSTPGFSTSPSVTSLAVGTESPPLHLGTFLCSKCNVFDLCALDITDRFRLSNGEAATILSDSFRRPSESRTTPSDLVPTPNDCVSTPSDSDVISSDFPEGLVLRLEFLAKRGFFGFTRLLTGVSGMAMSNI